MKKQVITIAFLSALLTLTGCGSDSSSSDSKSAEKTTAVTTTLAETTTASESTTAAAKTTESTTEAKTTSESGSAQLGKGIFGGFVTADTALKKDADAGSDTLITIPDGTQIGVCESGIDGWFMTDFQGNIGYIPANSVKEIQPFDPELGGDNVCGGSVSADVKLMSGTHEYAEALAEIPSGTQVMYYVSASDENWCVVSYQGLVGYVEADYIKNIEDYDAGGSEDPFEEYIGKWQSETQWNDCDFDIQISRDRETINVEVSTHSAVADYIWSYSCVCSEDGTFIECDGEGTLLRTDYSPNGDIGAPVIVYSDGTARFSIKSGMLFWEDCKDATASQVAFGKVE